MSLSYIPPKCAKTREPKDECCVSQCTYISNNIYDPIPLDNPKNHIALPYITLLVVYEYQMLHLSSCKLPTI